MKMRSCIEDGWARLGRPVVPPGIVGTSAFVTAGIQASPEGREATGTEGKKAQGIRALRLLFF